MNNKSISPNPQQPVDRVPAGQLPSALAELSEAELSAGVLPGLMTDGELGGKKYKGMSNEMRYELNNNRCVCSYDGDDE